MNPFEHFGKTPAGNRTPYRGNRRPVVAPEDDPLQALSAMERDVQDVEEQPVGAGVLPCEQPWLEISLFDAEDRPVADATYSLVGVGLSSEGRLGADGLIRIEDVEVDLEKVQVQVSVEEDDEGRIASYAVKLVPRVIPPRAPETPPSGTGEAEDYASIDFTVSPRPPPEDDRSDPSL
ncbi:hypothetical protein [Pyxidicoccus xibeiensis]|uniref:hypothetical protein n=1 Tax=Pyxidicoccus xibeiensis TaxID=2906759 RepID=UPI0020A74559|nr:hypothetical protein [Pyxidicoccus xibeiensis]MCP3143249.1 hypothetical protein [Pyxidicoccus xibeiensis]